MVEFCLGYDVVNTTFFEKEHIKTLDCLNRVWNGGCLDYAFADCHNVYSITNINSNITSMVGTYKNCYNMTNFTEIPSSVTSISECYEGCNNATNFPTIPNSVTNVSYTYKNCSLLSVPPTIPNSVTNMSGAFMNCTNLTIVGNFPKNVTDISHMYENCVKINGDIIINSTAIINAEEFFNNTNLEKDVYIPFKYDNGVYTTTYNSFITAGYSSEYRVDGVLLMDKDENYFDVDLSDYRYEIDENKIAHLYEYIGTKNIVIQSKVY